MCRTFGLEMRARSLTRASPAPPPLETEPATASKQTQLLRCHSRESLEGPFLEVRPSPHNRLRCVLRLAAFAAVPCVHGFSFYLPLLQTLIAPPMPLNRDSFGSIPRSIFWLRNLTPLEGLTPPSNGQSVFARSSSECSLHTTVDVVSTYFSKIFAARKPVCNEFC